jgi:hypothetical protein
VAKGAGVRKAYGRGGRRKENLEIKRRRHIAPKARSCANWKSHLSFNKEKGRLNLKMVREVGGGALSVLCVPCRPGKLEGPPLSSAHITLITSSLYKT